MTAAAIIIQYWTTEVNVAVWITIILFTILLLNIIAVSFFGEAEFWFASIKILAILGLIVLGVVLFFGGGPNHDRLGFRYWQKPGAFNPFMTDGNTGKFLAFWYAFIKSGFSFVMSPELITTAAGEAEHPRRNIPKAAERFIYRLFAFYVMGSLVIGVTVAFNDPDLMSAVSSGTGAGASPFVVAIQNAGIGGLNHVINAAILTSAWSSGNSWLFAGSRMLYSLACTEQAPKIFRRCNKRGVPYMAVLATFAVGCLAYLNVSSGGAAVFNWFTNITTISGFIAWIVVLVTYLVSPDSLLLPPNSNFPLTYLLAALPQSNDLQQPPTHPSLPHPPNALHSLVLPDHNVHPDPNQRLLRLQTRKLERLGLSRLLHHNPNLPRPLPRPQGLVPHALGDPDCGNGCLDRQGRGRSCRGRIRYQGPYGMGPEGLVLGCVMRPGEVGAQPS